MVSSSIVAPDAGRRLLCALGFLGAFAAPGIAAQLPPHPNQSCHAGELWSQRFLNPPLNAGDYVHIPAGVTVILDTSPPDLGGIWVEGNLIFDDLSPRTLSTAYLLVTGTLQIGCGRALPQTKKAKLILCDRVPNWSGTTAESVFLGSEVEAACLDRGLVVAGGGQLLLYGQDRLAPWCVLDATASQGATSLDLSENTYGFWKSGNQIAIASSRYDDGESEVLQLAGYPGSPDAPSLQAPTANEHLSFLEDTNAGAADWEMEMRSEVGLLTRTITIEGELRTGTTTDYGHVILLKHADATPWCDVSWTEFTSLGIEGALGRYPFHFHKLGDPTRNGYRAIFENNSIHGCHHRFLAIHNTQNVIVTGNVGYGTKGHGFYFEDSGSISSEHSTGVDLHGNLGFGVGVSAIGVLDSDKTEPSVFYVGHPNNRVSGNHAAGSEGHGFYLDYPDGLAWTHQNEDSFFRDNVAHSCGQHGVYQNGRPQWGFSGGPSEDPTVEGQNVWKCRQYGIWWRTYGTAVLEKFKIADCRGGLYPATAGLQDSGANFTGQLIARDGLLIGESADHQSSQPVEYPQLVMYFDPGGPNEHALPWDALVGVELYDGHLDMDGLRFAQFADTVIQGEDRPSGGLSQVAYESQYSENPQNRVRNCAFVGVDHRLFFRILTTMPNMIRNTVVFDEDGSLGGPSNTFYAVRTDALVANHHGVGAPAGNPAEGWYSLPLADAPFAQLTVVGTAPGSGGVPPLGQDTLRVSVMDWNHAIKSQVVRNTGMQAPVWPFNAILGNQYYGPGQETHGVYYCAFPSGVPSNQWPSAYRIEIEYAAKVGQRVIVGIPYVGPLLGGVELEVDVFSVVPEVDDEDNDQDKDLDDLMITTDPHAYVRAGNTLYVLTTTALMPGTSILPQGTKNILRF